MQINKLKKYLLLGGLLTATAGIQAQQAPLSLIEFVTLVSEKNENIRFQALETQISQAALASANGIFESQFYATFSRDHIQVLNTTEDKVSRGFQSTYRKDSSTMEMGIEKLLSTGAKVSMSYSMQDMTNNLQADNLQTNKTKEPEYQGFLGVSLMLPMLRNSGVGTTRANIDIASVDYDISGYETRRVEMEYVAYAASAYVDLQLAQAKLKLEQAGATIVKNLLQDVRQRYQEGKVAKGDVLILEAKLAGRLAQLAASKSAVTAKYNAALDMLATSNHQQGFQINQPLVAPAFVELNFDAALARAMKLRPEYLAAKKKVEQEGLRVNYAKNQMLPELNLNLEYGQNGLGKSYRSSLVSVADPVGETNASWSIGLEFKMPLSGNQQASSEYRAALLRKQQMEIRINALHAALHNVIVASVIKVKQGYEQFAQRQQVVTAQRQFLNMERARFKAGKVNGQHILEAEDEMTREQLALLEDLVSYQKSLLGLKLAEGSLLQSFNLESNI